MLRGERMSNDRPLDEVLSRHDPSALAVLVALILLVAGCGRLVTPAELERFGTRSYAGQPRDRVFRATTTALRSLGYDVVLVDDRSGRVKTAPKLVMVNAVAGNYTAHATESSLAWTVDVRTEGANTIVHAEPRAYVASQSMPATQLNSDFAERSFRTLFAEIDGNLPAAGELTDAAGPDPGHGAGGLGLTGKTDAPSKTATPGETRAKSSSDPAAIAAGAPASSDHGSDRASVHTTAHATDDSRSSSQASPSAPESVESSQLKTGDASAGTGVSVAALLGFGFNDAAQVGLGLRGGYTLPMKLYLGGMFTYHLGSSQTVGELGVFSTVHTNLYYLGIEGGYDISAGPLVVRPYVGLGPAWASVSVQTNATATLPGATATTGASSSNVGFWIGGVVLYPVTPNVGLGGDARMLVVDNYDTLSLTLTASYRF